MNELLRNISSPSWWVGVVIVGILINLISAYLKPRIDGIVSKFSTRRRNQLAADREFRKATVERLRADPHEQVMAVASELRWRMRSLGAMLLGAVCIICYIGVASPNSGLAAGSAQTVLRIAFQGMAAVILLLAMSELLSAMRIRNLLYEARKETGLEPGHLP